MKEKLVQYLRMLQATYEAVVEVHAQQGDDRCWMDFTTVFTAAELPPVDNSVGDKPAMLKNCERFVNVYCKSGGWHSYSDLLEAIQKALDVAEKSDTVEMKQIVEILRKVNGGKKHV